MPSAYLRSMDETSSTEPHGPLVHAEPQQREVLRQAGVSIAHDGPLRPLLTLSDGGDGPPRVVVLVMAEPNAGPTATEAGLWLQATTSLIESVASISGGHRDS